MPTLPPQTQRWPADRALLLVHGIGNAHPGDYAPLVAQLQQALGDDARNLAIYFLYYDAINEWFAVKTQAAVQVGALVSAIRSRVDSTALGNVIADFAGDVVWPVLIPDARQAVRIAMLQQLQQIVADGVRAGFQARDQHLSIMCHSLGCFHTFEALHAAAKSTTEGLAPGTDGVRFDNVIFMASPVQLIRTVAGALGAAVPQLSTLTTVSSATLSMPAERIVTGDVVQSVRRTVSITGNLDPVGGWFLRQRADWAFMNLPGQEVFIDSEQPTNVTSEAQLVALLQGSLRDREPPTITATNPHDWGSYIDRHAGDLKKWLLA
jgi:hypothetical protein